MYAEHHRHEHGDGSGTGQSQVGHIEGLPRCVTPESSNPARTLRTGQQHASLRRGECVIETLNHQGGCLSPSTSGDGAMVSDEAWGSLGPGGSESDLSVIMAARDTGPVATMPQDLTKAQVLANGRETDAETKGTYANTGNGTGARHEIPNSERQMRSGPQCGELRGDSFAPARSMERATGASVAASDVGVTELGGRPRLGRGPALFGIRPASSRARRSSISIWALRLRNSSAAHRARASWTAGSIRSSTCLRSLTDHE